VKKIEEVDIRGTHFILVLSVNKEKEREGIGKVTSCEL